MPASEAVYEKVTKVLMEALNVDQEEVTPTASLQGDLGAESIDFLDIVFRLSASSASRSRAASCSPSPSSKGVPNSCATAG